VPVYEYRCENCGALEERWFRRLQDVATPDCPNCNRPMARAVSAFAAHRDTAGKIEDAEARYGAEFDAKMGPEPDWGEYAGGFDDDD
jgi:putative FmdB family regulatory protein